MFKVFEAVRFELTIKSRIVGFRPLYDLRVVGLSPREFCFRASGLRVEMGLDHASPYSMWLVWWAPYCRRLQVRKPARCMLVSRFCARIEGCFALRAFVEDWDTSIYVP